MTDKTIPLALDLSIETKSPFAHCDGLESLVMTAFMNNPSGTGRRKKGMCLKLGLREHQDQSLGSLCIT